MLIVGYNFGVGKLEWVCSIINYVIWSGIVIFLGLFVGILFFVDFIVFIFINDLELIS